jgi:hypothetical protein
LIVLATDGFKIQFRYAGLIEIGKIFNLLWRHRVIEGLAGEAFSSKPFAKIQGELEKSSK